MSIKTLSANIQHCLDTTNNWTNENPILPLGVFGIEILIDNSIKIKLGDGSTLWNNLNYRFEGISVEMATEVLAGLVIKASSAEAISGINPNKYMTPFTTKQAIQANVVNTGLILEPGSVPYKHFLFERSFNNTTYSANLNYGSAEPVGFGEIPEVSFRMEHKGVATLNYTHRRLSGTGWIYTRISKNNSTIQEQNMNTNSYITRSLTISFVPGDMVNIRCRTDNTSTSGQIKDIQISIKSLI